MAKADGTRRTFIVATVKVLNRHYYQLFTASFPLEIITRNVKLKTVMYIYFPSCVIATKILQLWSATKGRTRRLKWRKGFSYLLEQSSSESKKLVDSRSLLVTVEDVSYTRLWLLPWPLTRIWPVNYRHMIVIKNNFSSYVHLVWKEVRLLLVKWVHQPNHQIGNVIIEKIVFC